MRTFVYAVPAIGFAAFLIASGASLIAAGVTGFFIYLLVEASDK